MCGVMQIGKYNVEYAGLSYDNGIPYSMVIIHTFDKNDKPTGQKQVLYFRRNRTMAENYIMPDLSTEEKISQWMGFKSHTKFQIFNRRIIEEI